MPLRINLSMIPVPAGWTQSGFFYVDLLIKRIWVLILRITVLLIAH